MTNEELIKIGKLAQKKMFGSLDPLHDYNHVNRVRNNAIKIVNLLNLKNVDTNLLQAICLLHDLTYIYHKPGLTPFLFEGIYIKKILLLMKGDLGINENDFQVMLKAAQHHPHSFPLRLLNKDRDVYCKILQDADTLDLHNFERVKRIKEMKSGNLYQKTLYYIELYKMGDFTNNLEKFLNYPELAAHFRDNV